MGERALWVAANNVGGLKRTAAARGCRQSLFRACCNAKKDVAAAQRTENLASSSDAATNCAAINPATMLIGQKGVKYGLEVRGAKPKAKPTAPVQKRSVFGDEDSDEDAGNNVEQQIARQAARKQTDKKVGAPCGPCRPLRSRGRLVLAPRQQHSARRLSPHPQ